MSNKSVKYDLTVRNYSDLIKVREKFSKFATITDIDDITYIEYKDRRIRLFLDTHYTPIRVGSVVNHFKGNKYYIQDTVINSEDSKHMLVYQALYPPYEKFVRYAEEFTDVVDFEKYPDSKQCYRFVVVPKNSLR